MNMLVAIIQMQVLEMSVGEKWSLVCSAMLKTMQYLVGRPSTCVKWTLIEKSQVGNLQKGSCVVYLITDGDLQQFLCVILKGRKEI